MGDYKKDLELAAVYDVDASKANKPLNELSEALKGFSDIRVKTGFHLEEQIRLEEFGGKS